VHAGTTLVSTSLAMAERMDASGQDVLAAIVLGYEASVALVRRLRLNFALRAFTAASSRSLAAQSPPVGCWGSTRLTCPGHRPVRNLDGWAWRLQANTSVARVSRRAAVIAGGTRCACSTEGIYSGRRAS